MTSFNFPDNMRTVGEPRCVIIYFMKHIVASCRADVFQRPGQQDGCLRRLPKMLTLTDGFFIPVDLTFIQLGQSWIHMGWFGFPSICFFPRQRKKKESLVAIARGSVLSTANFGQPRCLFLSQSLCVTRIRAGMCVQKGTVCMSSSK